MTSSQNVFTPSEPKNLLMLIGFIASGLIGGALYFQYFHQHVPCPLCIVQRYIYLFIAIFAFVGAIASTSKGKTAFHILIIICTMAGMATAAWHIRTIMFPSFSCGYDALQPIVDSLFFAKHLPFVFKTQGFCDTLYPPILGLSMPIWSLIGFFVLFLLSLISLKKLKKRSQPYK